ncbi:MAG: N-acetylmuramoyl-L-alanine amidase [Bacteroidota bacterium]
MNSLRLLPVVFVVAFACQNGTSGNHNLHHLFNNTAFLLKDSSLNIHFKQKEGNIWIYPNEHARRVDSAEFFLAAEEVKNFAPLFYTLAEEELLTIYQENRKDSLSTPGIFYTPWTGSPDSNLPLQGLRVALDAGHHAGNLEAAEIEGKYVKMRPSPATDMQEINFFEARLTLTTALLLAKNLTKYGAEVFLSREQDGKGTLGLSFEEWQTHQMEADLAAEMEAGRLTREETTFYRRKANQKQLGRLFNNLDLRARAKKINAFRPHLTLVLHYNVDAANYKNRDTEGYFPSNGRNYAMTFIPGAFMTGELDDVEDRLEFLRLLITDDLEESLKLSQAVMSELSDQLHLPIVNESYNLSYLERACVQVDSGIYARNLSLTRLVHGPVCYAEPLCQDHPLEAQALNKQDLTVNGLRTSSRIHDVVAAYEAAILKYAISK